MSARLAARTAEIRPFHVMALLERARALEAEGRRIVHMEIGEPDFPSPEPVLAAGIRALEARRTHYTPALGLPELRRAISGCYPPSARPDPERVAVTPGASGALQLALGVLVDPGDEVLLADPSYPCYRHLVRLFEGRPAMIPVGPETGYQLTAELVRRHWSRRTKAVVLASPANPTGTLVSAEELGRIGEAVAELGGVLIADEVYHGLTYGVEAVTALGRAPEAFVVNSFSKYYGMTGWRVGWLVAPAEYMAAAERLAQNLFLAAGTPGQYAALAALSPEVRDELERRREVFRGRRDFLLPALRELGFEIPVQPRGAFYIYADCSALTRDSFAFAEALLEEAGVAVTPGVDFGFHRPQRHLRFSYANTIENLREGVRRLEAYLKGAGKKRI